jgi:hypothetical protein
VKVLDDKPGPGAYDPSLDFVKKKIPSISLRGKLNDLMPRDISPGPGAYDKPTSIGKDTPSISMRGRIEVALISDVPGPGSYMPENVKSKVIVPKIVSPRKDNFIQKD